MERVPDRAAYVTLLVGDLDLYMEAAATRKIPDRRTGNRYEGTTADLGDCETTAGWSERAAHDHFGYRVSLTATAVTACFSPSSPYYFSSCRRS